VNPQAICIASAYHIDDLRQRLELETRFLAQQGLAVRLREEAAGKLRLFHCTPEPQSAGNQRAILGRFISNAVSDVIVNHWEQTVLERLVRLHYGYFSPHEQRIIRSLAHRHLCAGDDHGMTLGRKIARKRWMARRIQEFLTEEPALIIEGFVAFRVQEYAGELEAALDRAVEEYLMEREYQEFVGLLRVFVEGQKPGLERLQVILEPGGGFQLMDDAARPAGGQEGGGASREDLLLSLLVSIAPRQLLVHAPAGISQGRATHKALETIGKVFGGRLEVCTGCTLCQRPHPVDPAEESRVRS